MAVRDGIFKEQPVIGIEYKRFARCIAAINDSTSDGLLGLPYEGKNFKFWNYETKMYLFHKPSMTILEWWAQPDPNDVVKVNRILSNDEIIYLTEMFIKEIRESGI